MVNVFIVCSKSYSQGWIGSGFNVLYPVNQYYDPTNVFVGIGTDNPLFQLHTTKDVSFEVLTNNDKLNQIVVRDEKDGKLYWRDANTLGGGSGNFWSLNGNVANGNDFLGTMNAVGLSIKTNNVEKIFVAPTNKYVGINNNTPTVALEVTSDEWDKYIRVRGEAPSKRFDKSASSIYGGRIGFATAVKHFTESAQQNDFVIQNNSTGALIFGVGANTGGSNGVERVRISNSGNLGINTINPTAKLHGVGDVRLQDLPSGSGNILVVDANGYVHVSNIFEGKGVAPTENEVTQLKTEIADLRDQIRQLKDLVSKENVTKTSQLNFEKTISNLTLEVNPNPALNDITVTYNIKTKDRAGTVQILDPLGKAIKVFNVIGSRTKLISLTNVTSGQYLVSLSTSSGEKVTKRIIKN